jgi:hypothetical protein
MRRLCPLFLGRRAVILRGCGHDAKAWRYEEPAWRRATCNFSNSRFLRRSLQ